MRFRRANVRGFSSSFAVRVVARHPLTLDRQQSLEWSPVTSATASAPIAGVMCLRSRRTTSSPDLSDGALTRAYRSTSPERLRRPDRARWPSSSPLPGLARRLGLTGFLRLLTASA